VSGPARRGYLDLAHGQIHYREAGRADAPLLVLLHQTPSSSAMYEPLIAALAARYRVLAPDTPGFGLSDPLPQGFTIAAAAAALGAAVRQLHDGPACWFGHHTGAALALQLAHDHPQQVTRLALSGPCLLDDALRQRLPTLAASVPIAADGSHLLTLWQRMVAKDAAAPPALWQREVLAAAAAGSAYPEAYRAVVAVDTAAQLRALRCPTLVLAGTLDPLYGQLDAACRLLADGRKAEIPDARSYLCERDTAVVAALLGDFFDG
jgi:haloalkane dehalogenase